LNAVTIPKSTLKPVVERLPNGLTLIVQTETVSHTVTVTGSVKTEPNLEQPPGKDGVADVVDDQFAYGTTHLDRLAFARALDDVAATESAGSSFSLTVLASHFDRGVQLLADNELHPIFSQQNFETVRQKDAQATASQLQSPGYLLQRALAFGLLPKGDPDLREATLSSVMGLT